MTTKLPVAPHLTLVDVDVLRERLKTRTAPRGRSVSLEVSDEVRRCLSDEFPLRRDRLIEQLHLLSDAHQCLRESHLVALADMLKLSMTEVYEVATFYHHFTVLSDVEVAPDCVVRVCNGLSCELAGAALLLSDVQARVPKNVRVDAVPCTGRCNQAPAACVGQRETGFATADSIVAALNHPLGHGPRPLEPVVDLPAYLASGGYQLAQQVADVDVGERVLEALSASQLRGLGGAGFAAGRKWRIVQANIRASARPGLMVVNVDEGEPGTFKDRDCLERDPHRFLEGLLIAAQVVGCDAVYVYLRDEYHACRAMLGRELKALQGFAMGRPNFKLPRIEMRRGAGAYICGEESAMIESIEGKRGLPRLRPPFVGEVGLFGKPTLSHNLETLFWVRDIAQRGADAFARHGRRGRVGLRSFSVSGRVANPGVKLAPAGTSLRELINEHCGGMQAGHELYAFLPGGASGGIFPESLADEPLDFDTLQAHGGFIGSAAVVVLGHTDSAKNAALNTMRFFANESCGQCTPCRVGTEKAARLMEGDVWDESTMRDLCTVMQDSSICGLGQAAPNPIRCVFKYFAHEVQA